MTLGSLTWLTMRYRLYRVKFVGSIFTPDFTHTLSDLSFFRYTIGSAGFPPSFPMFSSGNGLAYDADDRVIFGTGRVVSSPTCVYVEATQQFAFVTRVPRAIFPRLDYLWPACLEGIAEEKKGSRDAGVSPGDWTTASIDFKLRNGRPGRTSNRAASTLGPRGQLEDSQGARYYDSAAAAAARGRSHSVMDCSGRARVSRYSPQLPVNLTY